MNCPKVVSHRKRDTIYILIALKGCYSMSLAHIRDELSKNGKTRVDYTHLTEEFSRARTLSHSSAGYQNLLRKTLLLTCYVNLLFWFARCIVYPVSNIGSYVELLLGHTNYMNINKTTNMCELWYTLISLMIGFHWWRLYIVVRSNRNDRQRCLTSSMAFKWTLADASNHNAMKIIKNGKLRRFRDWLLILAAKQPSLYSRHARGDYFAFGYQRRTLPFWDWYSDLLRHK